MDRLNVRVVDECVTTQGEADMRGRLDEFTTGDILQLFQISSRTGIVRVRSDCASERRIYVNAGRVSGADAVGWSLVDEVRRLEWLTPAMQRQLESMERDRDAAGLSLLVRSLMLKPRWDHFVELQLERLLYPALLWERGEFDAEVESVPRVAPLRVDLSPQELVLQAARWVEETRSAEADGLGLASRWRRTGEWEPVVSDFADELALVLRLLYQPRSLQDLCTSAGLSGLRVVDQVRRLRAQHFVEPV